MRAAIVLLLVIPAVVMLCACSAVRMTTEDEAACRDAPDGCTVWTAGELHELANRAAMAGYLRGWTDALKQREGI